MRWVAWFLLLLVAVGWLASELPVPETSAASRQEFDCWRRTRNGWERAGWLTDRMSVARPVLHPGVVALLELLLSMAALTAFPIRAERNAARNRGSCRVKHRLPRS